MFETAQIQLNNKLQELMEQQTLRQLVMFIVTAAAIVTGVVQFAVRSWQENDMTTKLKNATYKTLTVVYNTSHNLAMMIEENEDMRIDAQSQAQSWNRPLFAHKDPRSCIVIKSSGIAPKLMQFQVTDIEFDFDDELGTLSAGLQEDLICDVRTTIWEACDENDLIEEITCATGWCVKSIDYRHILNN